nr:hypothetical protein [Tessaracoccus defluvii]
MFGVGVDARAAGREHGLEVWAGGGHHEVSRQFAEGGQYLLGVLGSGRLAGDDGRARPDVRRVDAGRPVLPSTIALSASASMTVGVSSGVMCTRPR